MSIRFATSRRNSMRPLSFNGIPVVDCYAQIHALFLQHRDLLAAHGMTAPELFLAEPMHDPRSGIIDWYTDGDTMPVPLKSLPPERQQEMLRLQPGYARALQALIDELRTQPHSDTEIGVLAQAFKHPALDDIHVLGNQLILTNWGFAPGVAGAAPQDIMRLGAVQAQAVQPTPPPVEPPRPAAAPVPPVPPPPPPPTQPAPQPVARPALFPGCLSWLLLLLLLALLLWLLLAALGHLPSPLPAGCFRQEVSLQGEQLRSRTLTDEEARLLAQLEERAALCRPATPKADLRAERTPVLPELPKEEPKPEPEPEPVTPEELPFFGAAPVIPEEPKVEVPKGGALAIPKDAARQNDLSFLEGCWRGSTTFYNLQNEPVYQEYCFDTKGKGRRNLVERNSGKRCTGSARASFRNGQLRIEAEEASCGRGSYVPQSVRCEQRGSAAECSGWELRPNRRSSGKPNWTGTFHRK